MEYTATEIQTAVEKIIRSAIRRPYGTLGNRDLNTSLSDIQEAAAGIFILVQASPFYVVYLGTERAQELVDDAGELLAEMIEQVENINRKVTKIDSIVALNNARSSLVQLQAASASRDNSFADIEAVPAFKRFNDNLQRFIDLSSKNIRKNGEIVPTPQESKAQLPGLIVQLKEAVTEIVRVATNLKNSISDYSELNLPSVLSAGVMQRSREVLDAAIDTLEPLSPEARLSKMRDVTLDLLTSRMAVKNFTSLGAPGTFVPLDGSGAPYADEDHPGTPAILTADLPGPYATRVDSVEVDNELAITADSSFSFTIGLAAAFPARLDGRKSEPFDTTFNTGATQLRIGLQDAGQGAVLREFTVTLASGISVSIESVISAINAAAVTATEDVEAEAYFESLRFSGPVDLDTSGPDTTITHVNPALSWVDLGVEEGYLIEVKDSGSSNDGNVYSVNVGGVTASVLTTTLLVGSPTVTESSKVIEVGTASRRLRIRISDAGIATALANGTKLYVLEQSDLERDTASVLGYLAGVSSRSQGLTAQNVALAGNLATTSALDGVSRLAVDYTYLPSLLASLSARSEPTDPTLVVVFKTRQRADLELVAGTQYTWSATGASTAGVVVGDDVIIRSSLSSADIGLQGTVDAVTDTSVTITFTATVTSLSNVLIEILPTLSSVVGATLHVEDGGNQGYYLIEQFGAFDTSPLAELRIRGSLPSYAEASGQPVFFSAEIGQYYSTFTSSEEGLSSKIEVPDPGVAPNDSAAGLFFSSLPASAVGTTPYFKIPEYSRLIEEGDMLELLETSPLTVSQTFTITGIEKESLLLEVTPEMNMDLGSFPMEADSQVPRARIRKAKKNNFETLKEAVEAWLDSYELTTAYFRELDRRSNQLIVEKNPTVGQVNDVKQLLLELWGTLTIVGAQAAGLDTTKTLEAAFTGYQVAPVDEIDTLVRTFTERGSDRAIQILLEGRFQDFFDLDVDEMSYAGTVMKGVKELTREDLALRRTRRKEHTDGVVILGTYEQPDFEFDQSDIDDVPEPDLPGNFLPPRPGDAY